MKQSDLITECRERLDDVNTPYLWSDDFLTRNLNQAQDEAAARAFLLYDETTASICDITVTPPTRIFTLSPYILRVESAKLASQTRDMARDDDVINTDVLRSSWRAATGVPDGFGVVGNLLFFNRAPLAADTLHIRVRRRPLTTEQLVLSTDEPVIAPEFHLDLIHWVLYKAFSKKDADGRSDKDALYHLDMFEARFGKKPSAKAMNTIKSARHRNRMHGPKFGA